MVSIFAELCSALGSFAASSDYLFGFTFISIGVIALITGLFKFLHV